MDGNETTSTGDTNFTLLFAAEGIQRLTELTVVRFFVGDKTETDPRHTIYR